MKQATVGDVRVFPKDYPDIKASKDEIKNRLVLLRSRMPGRQDCVYDFAEQISKYVHHELVPEGFIMASVLALYDIGKGIDGFTGKPLSSDITRLPPMMLKIFELEIPNIAKAIFPDDFAAVVKERMTNIQKIQHEAWEKKKAEAPKPTINGDPLMIFRAARRIADLSFEFYQDFGKGSDKYCREDRRKEGVNPYYHQTTGGLFLNQYYSGPGSIWTPWGEWGCWGSGCSGDNKDPMEDFLAAIGEVELHTPVKHTRQGVFGPVYAIKRVGDIQLPVPELREQISYFEYEEANRLWEEVSTLYKSCQ